MNISEFWKEQKEERKQKKLLKKQGKKVRTKEQKLQRFFGIILALIIIFVPTYNSCSSTGDINLGWNDILGLSNEIVEELNKEVDINLLLPNGKLNIGDLEDANNTLINQGIDIFEKNTISIEKLDALSPITTEISLTDFELGAIIKEISDSNSVDLMFLEISEENSVMQLKTIAYVQLKNIISGYDIPSVYLTTISRIRYMSDGVSSLNASVQINKLSQEDNKAVNDALSGISQGYLNGYVNEIVANNIKILMSAFQSKITFVEHGVIFQPK